MKLFKERLKISLLGVGQFVLMILSCLAVVSVAMTIVVLVTIYAWKVVVFLMWAAGAIFALIVLFLVTFYIYWQFIEPFKK
ncbi:hypothetical protein EVJ32_04875 [Exiguobacterium sp. SH5S4]|uniref:hypothetical protein n=1 Tax=Exiguobacterium sp. SH5S4 TaxID=2510961 RepID=UPI00103C807D|nr:hypothetical protein [Exiguobacterium sp. SH5S4]TCI26710.1 hypothetical protein EVJ32_04875 [Exiguobacterium sp. SH5S4]